MNEVLPTTSAAPSRNRREGVLVVAIVLAPFALAFILVVGGLLATAGWQTARGVTVAGEYSVLWAARLCGRKLDRRGISVALDVAARVVM